MVRRGRKKTVLKTIEKQESRLVCFSKRRSGLFKKASELSILTGAKVGAIVFSPAGKLFTLETPTIDSLTGCQMEEGADSSTESESVDAMVGKEAPFWWNKPQVQAMSFEELLQFQRKMLDYGEKKFGNCAERLLQGNDSTERTLFEENPSFCCNDSTESVNNSMQIETEMFPSTFGPNFVFDEQWLQWLDEWMIDP
uniref:MADS-box protein-like protein n=1 Tax=Cymbidium goeringii TaxID=112607 RepID=A0A455LA50_9ASPA|nr:MADS-box protein-like protein [Cymbidium goeringii]